MPVNKGEDAYNVFLDKHANLMSDNACLLQDVVCIGEDSTGAIEMDKEFMDVDLSGELNSPIPEGTIVRATLKGNTRICIITKE